MAAPTYPEGVETRLADMSGVFVPGAVVEFSLPDKLLKISTGDPIYPAKWTVAFNPQTGKIPAQPFPANDQDDIGISPTDPVTGYLYGAQVIVPGQAREPVFYFGVPGGVGVLDLDTQAHYSTPGIIEGGSGEGTLIVELPGSVTLAELATALETVSGLPDPAGNGGEYLRVKEDESGFELVDPPTGGAPGDDGASAYEVARANGFVGTEAQWLASLKGTKGDPGDQGPPGGPGANGAPGAPAQVYVQQDDGTFLLTGVQQKRFVAYDSTRPSVGLNAGDELVQYDPEG